MISNDLLALIDAEIANLQKARSILSAALDGSLPSQSAGSPAAKPATPKRKRKHRLTPEGRAKIAEAMKRRWAAHRAKQKSKA